jgi:hypothetical protein
MQLKTMGLFIGDYFKHGSGGEDQEFAYLNARMIIGDFPLQIWKSLISNLAIARDQAHDRWGFKDPALSQLIFHYVGLFPDAIFINCVRHRAEVVGSLIRTYGWSSNKAETNYWVRRLLLEKFCPKDRTLTLRYDEVLQDPAGRARELAQFCEIETTEEQIDKAAKLVVKP